MAEYAETQHFETERFESDSVHSRHNTRPTIPYKRHYKIVRPFFQKGKDGKYYKSKNVTIEMYGSGDTGSQIRNAVTGLPTNYLVGSKEEDLFYKVSICTGVDKENGPIHLFYDSPAQYENHQFTTVSEDVKEWWSERFLEAKSRLIGTR